MHCAARLHHQLHQPQQSHGRRCTMQIIVDTIDADAPVSLDDEFIGGDVDHLGPKALCQPPLTFSLYSKANLRRCASTPLQQPRWIATGINKEIGLNLGL